MKGEPLFEESKIYNELNAFTKIAIEEFSSVCKNEVLLEKSKRKLKYYVKRVTDKDMSEYVKITEQLEKRMQDKIDNLKDEIR